MSALSRYSSTVGRGRAVNPAPLAGHAGEHPGQLAAPGRTPARRTRAGGQLVADFGRAKRAGGHRPGPGAATRAATARHRAARAATSRRDVATGSTRRSTAKAHSAARLVMRRRSASSQGALNAMARHTTLNRAASNGPAGNRSGYAARAALQIALALAGDGADPSRVAGRDRVGRSCRSGHRMSTEDASAISI